MKTLVAFTLVALTALAPKIEFRSSQDELLYPDVTMRKLKHIVDSLNLKFKVCELNKQYLSQSQARAHYVSLEGRESRTALADLEAGISFKAFLAKYPAAKVDENLLVVTYDDIDEEDQEQRIVFTNITGNGDYAINKPTQAVSKAGGLQGKWIGKFDDYKQGSVEAFYFVRDFAKKHIPEKYGRWIQYVDCLIDTTSRVYTEKAVKTGRRFNYKQHPKTDSLLQYVMTATRRPRRSSKMDESAVRKYMDEVRAWDSLRVSRIDSMRRVSNVFDQLLVDAVEEAKVIGSESDQFEEYVELYYSPELALQFKRDRIVVGACSMDESPRYHAMNIARLSAETINWDIFLRAHLDIMNDYFERTSDASGAWAGRMTYIRELEELDINVPDLMMGLVLRAENVSKNHYSGSIGRIGRSLSESRSKQEIEFRILTMICDAQLDDYNRTLAYYLFKNYNYYLTDKVAQRRNEKRLNEAMKTLPLYLSAKLDRK